MKQPQSLPAMHWSVSNSRRNGHFRFRARAWFAPEFHLSPYFFSRVRERPAIPSALGGPLVRGPYGQYLFHYRGSSTGRIQGRRRSRPRCGWRARADRRFEGSRARSDKPRLEELETIAAARLLQSPGNPAVPRSAAPDPASSFPTALSRSARSLSNAGSARRP